MTRTVKEPGANKALRETVKRLEARVKTLETDSAEHAARLDKLEVVRVPSPTVEPDYPQRPETE